MPKSYAAALFISAAVFLAGTCLAQAPAQTGRQEPVMKVEVKDGLLSVESAGAEFGSVLKAVAAKAGIEAAVSGDVSVRPVTTRFRNLEVEEGISRLLSLMQEKNYTFTYGKGGRLERVEVYGSSAPAAKTGKVSAQQAAPSVKKSVTKAPSPAPPAVQKNPPASKRIIRSKKEDAELPAPAPATDPLEGIGSEDEPGAAPVFPSEKEPPYIPPKTR